MVNSLPHNPLTFRQQEQQGFSSRDLTEENNYLKRKCFEIKTVSELEN